MPVPSQYPVLMPDTAPEIISELDNSPAMRRTKDELVTGARFQQEYAILRQQKIAEANSILEHRVMEGLGQKVGEIDQELYFQYMQLYGRECWADPDFVADTLRKNPWMRIHTRFPTRILVDGFRSNGSIGKGAAGNRSIGRTDAAPATVRVIEHSAAPRPAAGSTASPSDAKRFRAFPPAPAEHKIVPFAQPVSSDGSVQVIIDQRNARKRGE